MPESSAAARWIRELRLAPHPEGGWYRETYRAGDQFPGAPGAGCWFAAEVAEGGKFSLLGCTVAPGFDFADFELADGIELAAVHAQHAPLIRRLTRSGDAGNNQGGR